MGNMTEYVVGPGCRIVKELVVQVFHDPKSLVNYAYRRSIVDAITEGPQTGQNGVGIHADDDVVQYR